MSDASDNRDVIDQTIRLASHSDGQTEIMLAEGIDRCPIPIFVLDREHRIQHWNKALEAISGLMSTAMIGTRQQWRAFYPQERPTLADLILDGAFEQEIDHYYHAKFGKSSLIDGAFEAEDYFPSTTAGGRWLFFTAALLRDQSGKTTGVIETLQDVTTRRHAEVALQESRQVLAQVVDGMSVPTFVIDLDHRVTHWNRACEVLTGTPASAVLGTSCQWQAFYPSERPVMADLIVRGSLEADFRGLYANVHRPSHLIEGAFEASDFFPHFGHNGKWLFFTAAPLRDRNGLIIGAIETLQDITEQKRAEAALRESEERYRQMSITDALTALYNSRHFFAELEREMDRAGRYAHPLSLLLVDADKFKQINDTYGHLEGDRVLQELAQAIRNALRSSDSAYRYGGEEFAVILPETPLDAALSLAERLRERFFSTPVELATGIGIHASVSIGVAEYVRAETSKSFIRRADDSVYEAKRAGRNRVVALHPRL